jgi:ATP synthase F1 complex assembly factor 1
MKTFYKLIRKPYFNYPCPRKLREIVKITLFEREQPTTIKDLWKQYYDEKPRAFGVDIQGNEMDLVLKK